MMFFFELSLRKAQTSLNYSKSLLCFWKFANRHQLSCIWVFHRVFVHVASQRWSIQTLPWPRTTSSHKSGKFSSFRPLSFYFVCILMFSSYFMSNFLSKFKLLSVVLCLGVLWWVMCLDSYKYLSSLLVVFHPTCLSSSIPMCLSLFIFLCLFVVVPSLMFTEPPSFTNATALSNCVLPLPFLLPNMGVAELQLAAVIVLMVRPLPPPCIHRTHYRKCRFQFSYLYLS